MNASGNGNNDYPMHPEGGDDHVMHPENEQRRKGKGRQKIEMAKIENDTNLQVTFSKRRAGVFKKASELSTLCGAQCAVLVFSPGNKPHSYGHPSVDAVTNRFLHTNGGGGGGPPGGGGSETDRMIKAHYEAAENQRNKEVVAVETQVEQAKQRRRELDAMAPVLQMESLNYEQLQQLRNSVLMYKQAVQAKFSGGAGVYGQNLQYPPMGYGQNVQYPPTMGYNAATGSSNANVAGAHLGANYGGYPGSSDANIDGAQGGANYGGYPGSSDPNINGAQGGANHGGYPGNYHHHHPGY